MGRTMDIFLVEIKSHLKASVPIHAFEPSPLEPMPYMLGPILNPHVPLIGIST